MSSEPKIDMTTVTDRLINVTVDDEFKTGSRGNESARLDIMTGAGAHVVYTEWHRPTNEDGEVEFGWDPMFYSLSFHVHNKAETVAELAVKDLGPDENGDDHETIVITVNGSKVFLDNEVADAIAAGIIAARGR